MVDRPLGQPGGHPLEPRSLMAQGRRLSLPHPIPYVSPINFRLCLLPPESPAALPALYMMAIWLARPRRSVVNVHAAPFRRHLDEPTLQVLRRNGWIFGKEHPQRAGYTGVYTLTYTPRPEDVPHSFYRLFDEWGRLLYVGISKDSLQRLSNHLAAKPWGRDFHFLERTLLPSRPIARLVEKAEIELSHPIHNKRYRLQSVPEKHGPAPTGPGLGFRRIPPWLRKY